MRYVCLTCDYDGTIARNGKVAQSTLQALEKTRSSGRKIILATGRELDDLLSAFPEVSLFDRVVAENGGLLYRPATREQIVLAESPPPQFVEELARRGVQPLSAGRCAVATWHPHETTVLEVIRTMSLELQIIFNKNAVMVLPSGINKGTGLKVALNELGLSRHNVVGIGDAENDHAFLGLCECSIAVGNALPALQERADWVTCHSHGAGVEEAIQLLLRDDLSDLAPRLSRHDILLGSKDNGEPFFLPAYGSRLLVAGPSGSGKSTVVSAIVERLVADKYQVCLFDPEGDYDEFEEIVTLGGPERIPAATEILEILNNPSRSLTINLLGVPLADRPSYFQTLLARAQELRFKTGRPHWIVIDEAHHVLPADLGAAGGAVPKELDSFVLVTVHPDLVSPAILSSVEEIIAVGPEPQAVVNQFSKATSKNLYWDPDPRRARETGRLLAWHLPEPPGHCYVKLEPAKNQRRRHQRKYASGELGEDKSFYFRGAEGKLNLRAQNMNLFAQLAEGVDEETWSFHLSHGDYSRWLRDAIKDEAIAGIVAGYETDRRLSPSESRRLILTAIRQHYTAPA
ncbi:MAG: HAD family hydrolase [Candidatus Acidiferrum sp.]|jgi:HAD superfamily hydrolase (TIGR01484 family)